MRSKKTSVSSDATRLFADIYVKEGEGQGWDVFPSGKEFVLLKGRQAAPPKIMVVINWQQLIEGGEKK